jgi:protein-tyrosine phosphatase
LFNRRYERSSAMIDIHSHILFGLDDGAQTPEDTLNMAKQAAADGITMIVATPHHQDGTYNNPPEKVIRRLEEVNRLLGDHEIPLQVLAGMEVHVDGNVVESIQEGKLITYNGHKRHMLLELPHDHVPRYIDKLIFNLQLAGIIPIIPHPERNRELREDPNRLYRLVKQGAMAQLTAASVVGKFGKKIQKCCDEMMKHNLVHFIATDAHNVGSRGVVLREAYEFIGGKYGLDYVEMYQEFASNIVNGLDCDFAPPEKLRKKFLGIF